MAEKRKEGGSGPLPELPQQGRPHREPMPDLQGTKEEAWRIRVRRLKILTWMYQVSGVFN